MRRKFSFTQLVLSSVAVLTLFIIPAHAADDFESEQGEDIAVDNSATADIVNLGPFGGDLWDVAIDTTNDMVYTVAKASPNGFYRSNDGGENWIGLEGVDYGGSTAVEVDQTTGDVYAVFSRGVYKSTDRGETFTRIIEDSSDGFLYVNDILMMGSNSNTGTINISSDNGENFNTVTFSSTGDHYVWDIDYSADGDAFFLLSYDEEDLVHVFTSVDNGETWDEISVPEIPANEVRFGVNPMDVDNMIITAGYSDNLYYTISGDEGWVQSNELSSGVTFDHLGRAWIGERYSDDGGVTWSSFDDDNANSALGGHKVTVDPADENIVYADGMPGLSKSTDRGETWSDINNGISGVTITDISQAADKDIVWAAAYNGIAKTENFTSVNPTWQFPVLEEPGSGIWTNPENPDVVVVGIIGGMKRSIDGGETWSDTLAGDLMDSRQTVDDIMADVSDLNILYAAVSNNDPSEPKTGAILMSTDQGETWSDMELLDSGSAQTMDQATDGTIYVGIGTESDIEGIQGVYKYSEGEWEFLENSPAEDITKVIVDPNDDNVIYAIASVLYNNQPNDTFGFYKSEDAGATWTRVTDGLSELTTFDSLAVQHTDPTTLYLGSTNIYGQGVLLKSSDSGETWDQLYTGLQDETFYTLIFDGVTLGSSRGLFEIKSKVTLNLTKGKQLKSTQKQIVKVTLKDAVTNKVLKNQKIRLKKKTSNGYRLIKTKRTNNRGKIEFKVPVKAAKTTKYKVQWNPKNQFEEEYIPATSNQVSIKVKK